MIWEGQQYEYLVMGLAGLPQERALNAAGRKGWELVSVSGDIAYLKRPIALVLDEEGFWVEEPKRPEPPPPPPPAKRERRQR